MRQWSRCGVILGALAMMWVGQGCIIDLAPEADEPGYTQCGDFLADPGQKNYCQPGQYCEDPTFSECIEGCLSNENCADDQRCVKSDGQNVGTCQAEIKRPASNPR
ncbi:MAG: hypothetical protein VYE40_17900 [Myxococcota bacterium]|nr:hypothetical protein [Myxococcota bacterium]